MMTTVALNYMQLLQVLMTLLALGGGNELLDYVPTAAYWKGKGVDVTAAEMRRQLAPVAVPADLQRHVENLASSSDAVRSAAVEAILAYGVIALPQVEAAAKSPNPDLAEQAGKIAARLGAKAREPAVRRLMAIRALGELGDRGSLEVLRELGRSETPFEADYARTAVAAIEGRSHDRPAADVKAAEADAWLLPQQCALIFQARLEGHGAVDLDKVLAAGAPAGQAARADRAERLVAGLVDLAERVGNFRVDVVTVGLFTNPRDGCAIVLRGRYDARLLAQVMRGQGAASHIEKEIEVFETARADLAVVPESDQRLVALMSSSRAPKPLDETVAAIKAGKGGLEQNAEVAGLLKALDPLPRVRGVVRLNDGYRRQAWLKSINTVRLTAEPRQGKLHYEVQVEAEGVEQMQAAAQGFARELSQAMAQAERTGREGPPFAMEILRSAKVTVDGDKATLTFESTASPLMLPLLTGSPRLDLPAPPGALPVPRRGG